MKKWLIKIVIRRLLKKKAPESVRRSGPEALKVDCYAIYIRDSERRWSFYVDEVNNQAVTGTLWDRNSNDKKHSMSLDSIKFNEIEIYHMYKLHNFMYSSLTEYIIKGLTRYDYIQTFFDKAGQLLFNMKHLVRSERMDVLKLLFESYIDDPRSEINAVSLMSLLHSQRWVFHPDKQRQMEYNRFLLDSLVESGDLEKTKYGYKISAKALQTISLYEESERKHQDNLQQSKLMNRLTLFLIMIVLLQAIIMFISIYIQI